MWSWDITYLPTTWRGISLYLYLVIDVLSRTLVDLDVDELEDPAIAAVLVSLTCLRERISKGRKQPLILHADNGNAMRAATVDAALMNWASSGRSHSHGCPMTTRTRNRCSGQ